MDAATLSLLRRVPVFESLDERSLEMLAGRSRRRRFPSGDTLFHEGEPGHTLYVVVSGRVRIQTLTAAGEIVHIATRGPGETVGEMSLIDGKDRMADAVIAESADLLMLHRSDFERCLEVSPRMALAIMGCLADRLREAADQLERLQSQDVLGRVAGALLELARDGEGYRPVRVVQQELADEIGAARESVNRALSRLRGSGAIDSKGRTVTITDPDRLRRFSQRT
jgi:CRP/FNR family cyclic AMP-dependent transcriptional regulator